MFNPLTKAQQIIATTKMADPDEIADLVAEATPPEQVEAIYRTLLRSTAREAIRLQNMTASEPPKPRTTPNRSSRVASIQAAHTSYYDQRVYVDGAWKLLGDCTVANIYQLAQDRRAIAEKNEAKAKEFELLAERMERAGVETARELEEVAA